MQVRRPWVGRALAAGKGVRAHCRVHCDATPAEKEVVPKNLVVLDHEADEGLDCAVVVLRADVPLRVEGAWLVVAAALGDPAGGAPRIVLELRGAHADQHHGIVAALIISEIRRGDADLERWRRRRHRGRTQQAEPWGFTSAALNLDGLTHANQREVHERRQLNTHRKLCCEESPCCE